MNRIKKDSFFLNKMAALKESNKDYSIYTVLPQYGEGTIIVLNIIPGMNLIFDNLILKDKIVNCFSEYEIVSQRFLKISYCLKGRLLVSNQEGKMFLGSKGVALYYEGVGNVRAIEHYDKPYQSITILGYSNEIMKSFEEIFQIDKRVLLIFIN